MGSYVTGVFLAVSVNGEHQKYFAFTQWGQRYSFTMLP